MSLPARTSQVSKKHNIKIIPTSTKYSTTIIIYECTYKWKKSFYRGFIKLH